MDWNDSLANLAPSMIPMTVFAASILGSLHCVGMCGPIQQSIGNRAALFHLGRLISYSFLGAAAGFLGEGLLARVQSSEIALAIGFVFSATLAWIGYRTFFGKSAKHGKSSAFAVRIWKFSFQLQSPSLRSVIFGVLTPLLPCAWLYSFVVGAALTESPIWGAVFMASFWLGTIPALSLFPVLRRLLSPRFGAGMNKAAGGLFFAAAFLVVAVRVLSVFQAVSCH